MRIKKKEFPFLKVEAEAAGAYGDFGVPTPEPYKDDIDAFGLHTWVYACANIIANAFSSIEFIPYKQVKGDVWEPNESHPFFKLMKNPNPSMSAVEFRRVISLSSKLTGNAYINCEPDGRKPVELWPLQPDKVTVKTDATKFIAGYAYNANGNIQSIAAEKIIHIREATPSHLQYGQGSLTAAKNAVTSDLLADAWNRYFFANSARPDALLQSDTPISAEVQRKVVEQWKKTNGGPKNNGKIAVLSGLKYVEINRMHKDMDFVNLRKMLREEILAAFGVPQSMVGILDQANYSNMKEQTKVFWVQTMIPEIRKFESAMTLRAAQITGDDKTIIQADLSKVEALRDDEAAKAATAQIYVNMGVPLGQVVEALDLPFEIEADSTAPAGGSTDGHTAEDDPKNPAAKSKSFQIDTPRDIEWKKFDRDAAEIETAMESSLRAFFKSQARRVLSKFLEVADTIVPANGKNIKTDEDKITYFFDFDKEKNLLGRVTEKWIKLGYYKSARRMAEKIGGDNGGVNFNVDERAAGAWIQRKVLKLQQETTKFTHERLSDAVVEGVRDATAEGLSQSETIAQIEDRITEFFDFSATGRAERIARTEVIGASNAASLDTMKQLGAVGKTWLTSRDNRVREMHVEMEGQEVPIDQPFLTEDGDQLMYPGDQSAGPGATINCRCTLLPVTEK